jgi:superfamily II DNA or RNA helicase
MQKKTLFDFDFSINLPGQEKFPINETRQDRTVREILLKDIRVSEDYLIITGFTSLSQLVEIFGAGQFSVLRNLRVVIGFDPDERVGRKLAHYSLPTEIKNYWLKQNVSIRLCGPIINLIEKIRDGNYNFRVKDKLHAKLYIGRHAAILGSSNFSKSGTIKQAEANIRVQPSVNDTEKYQYESIKQLAEFYYNSAEDYNDCLIDLLQKLLKDVTWEEALARAIAEILESKWMKDYPVLYNALLNHQLWPSQKIGIAKAMKIIQDQGRVLIADPTGSGKTKLATALAYTLFHWLWENGLKDRSSALIICPKQVMDNWDREQEPFKIYNKIESMGKLSQGKEKNIKQLQKEIESKDILIIDEAHNYLRPSSLRSKAINPRGATHIVLSTATPINKKPEDLLRLIELLDIDNLSDEDLKKYKELRSARRKPFDKHQLDNLRTYINQFIVRRTKRELNRMIEREPSAYTNRNNHFCKYPKPVTDTYRTGETDDDKRIAKEITDLALQLKGIQYLTNWKIPLYYRNTEEKKQYITNRLRAAGALAAFMVRACLRSSKCALHEYIHGTEAAKKQFLLSSVKKESTGNIIDTIQKKRKSFSSIKFPKELTTDESEWLTVEKKFQELCKKEIDIYHQISSLALQLTNNREEHKAQLLLQQMEKFGKILAFDSKIITLEYMRDLLEKKAPGCNIIVATGSNEKSKALVKEYFNLQTTNHNNIIALCSDAMAEGINLPDAKALVLLDMPSVLRLIEQRIGRLERMDSEHEEIHIFWPDDAEAFSLKGDKRIVDILLMAENLIGINVDIPRTIYDRHLNGAQTTQDFIRKYEEYREKDQEWEGVKDNTQSLYSLIEGETALIDVDLYKEFADVEASVKTAISFVETEKTFSFFAFRGDATRSPKWLFIDERNKSFTDFDIIAQKLREYLSNERIVQRKWNEVSTDKEIKNILLRLRQKERSLLPHKKRRALEIAEKLLKELLVTTSEKDSRKPLIQKLLILLRVDDAYEEWIDYNHFATLWLSYLLPVLDKLRNEQQRKRRIITLADIRLKHMNIDEAMLSSLVESCQYAATLDELIAACIIGIPIQK